jgi:hypothetical protein
MSIKTYLPLEPLLRLEALVVAEIYINLGCLPRRICHQYN